MLLSCSVLRALEIIKEHKRPLNYYSCNIDSPLHPSGFTRNYILITFDLDRKRHRIILQYNTSVNKGHIVSYTNVSARTQSSLNGDLDRDVQDPIVNSIGTILPLYINR